MIIFDIEPLQNKDYVDRGIGRYVRNILHNSYRCGIDFKITYNPKLPLPSINRLAFNADFFPATRANFLTRPASWLVTLSPFEKSQGDTVRLMKACNPDTKIATLVYDLIPMVFEKNYLSNTLDRLSYGIGLENLLKSDSILSISNYTKTDVEKILKPHCPVVNIGTGVDDLFFYESIADSNTEWNSFVKNFPILQNKKIIFTVSGGHKTKNLPELLNAYSECPLTFRLQCPLVIGGGMPIDARTYFYNEWNRLLKKKGYGSSEIVILPHISDGTLRAIYRSAWVFVYASLYEGFGLPLAEAIVSGAVCVASNASSLAEILPLEDYSFSASDTVRMTDLIMRAARDVAYRDRFLVWASERKNSYMWEPVCRRLRDALPSAQDKKGLGGSNERIAIVGPSLPAQTGIADYNEKIIPDIIADERFTFFSSNNAPLMPTFTKSYPHALLKEVWPRFTDFVYIIGNSFQHLSLLESLEKHPGYIWLHDVGLRGLAWNLAQKTSPDDPWDAINALLLSYPGSHQSILDMHQLESSSYGFAKPLLKNALGFIVHSQHAKRLLQEDLGNSDDRRQIVVIPHAVPEISSGIKQARGQDGKIVIGMLGFMAPIRSPELVIASAGSLTDKYASITIRVVGNCAHSYQEVLSERCAEYGVKLEVTGYLEEGAFLMQVADLDVVVQIRQRSNGESSGTVATAMALGIPVVTNIPSALEFWESCLLAVPGAPTPQEITAQLNVALSPEFRANYDNRLQDVRRKFSFEEVASMFIKSMDAMKSKDRSHR